MEKFVKKFPWLITPIQVIMTLVLYVQCAFLIGVAMFPSMYLIQTYWTWSEGLALGIRYLGLSFAISGGYFLYCISIIFVVGAFRFITRLKITEGRYYMFSWKAIEWANFNAVILVVRYTCMNFLRVTPFLVLFHRMMGAKIGKNVQINTSVFADSCLIEVGDNTSVGGDVTLVAHLAEGDQLVVKKVKIGSNVTLGIMTIIVPGVEIGDGAMIAANTVFKKNTKVPPNTVWAGIPAKQIRP